MMHLTTEGVWDRKTNTQSGTASQRQSLQELKKKKKIKNLYLPVMVIYSDRNWMEFWVNIFQENRFLQFWERQKEPKITHTDVSRICRCYHGIKKKAAN